MEFILNMLVFSISSLFIVSSVTKMVHLKYFINIVIDYKIIRIPYATVYAAMLPFLELSGAIFLLLNQTIFYGMSILLIVLLSFLFAVSRIVSTNKTVACGCYGKYIRATIDRFTLFKIYVMVFSIFILLIMKGNFIVTYSLPAILSGIFITLLLLLCQKVWVFHQETMKMINVNKIN